MREPESNPDEMQIMATTASAILGTPSAAWSEALTCEARNSLQVVLSGAEILLEDHFGNLHAQQKALFSKSWIMPTISAILSLYWVRRNSRADERG